MTTTEAGVYRRHVLASAIVLLAGCSSEGPSGDTGQTATPTPTDTAPPTDASTPDQSGWSVRFAYDGDWQESVSVTTDGGSSHQAFDGEGDETVDVETRLGVETEDVRDIVATAQKRASDDDTLRVAIRKDGELVAEGSTDEPVGQVMVSHHV